MRAELDVSGRDVELRLLDTGRSGSGDHGELISQASAAWAEKLASTSTAMALWPASGSIRRRFSVLNSGFNAHATGTILESLAAIVLAPAGTAVTMRFSELGERHQIFEAG